jgi:hypothetical protein
MAGVFVDDFTIEDEAVKPWDGHGRQHLLTYSGTGLAVEAPGTELLGTSAIALLPAGCGGVAVTVKVTANAGLAADLVFGILFARFEGLWIPVFSSKGIPANAVTAVVSAAAWHENDSGAGPAKYNLTDPILNIMRTNQQDSNVTGLVEGTYWGTGLPVGVAEAVRLGFAVLDADDSGSTFSVEGKVYAYR